MWISHFQSFLTIPQVVLLKRRYNKCYFTLLSPVGWKVAMKWHVQVCVQIKLVNAPKKNNNTSKYFLPTHCSFSQTVHVYKHLFPTELISTQWLRFSPHNVTCNMKFGNQILSNDIMCKYVLHNSLNTKNILLCNTTWHDNISCIKAETFILRNSKAAFPKA